MFDAKGKEENLDLGVHFGFAPQIETGGHYASFFGSQAAGAQIDMRQVYLTAGGTWGQLLMGKELGLFQRGNILNDMTLLGVGVGGGGRRHGPRPHRLRLPVYRVPAAADLLHARPAGRTTFSHRPVRGLASRAVRNRSSSPGSRPSSHYTGKAGEKTNIKFFLNGAAQTAKSGATGTTESLTSTGVGGGATVDIAGFALHGVGLLCQGHGLALHG